MVNVGESAAPKLIPPFLQSYDKVGSPVAVTVNVAVSPTGSTWFVG